MPRRGYTLVEVVLVVVILSIVGLATSTVVVESMSVYARTAPALDASYQAHLAAERMTRDLRALGDRAGITLFTPTALTFVDTGGVPVAYSAAGGVLTRNGDLLARGVTSFRFDYWARDGSPAALPGDVHLFGIDLTVQTADQPYRVRTVAFPRALSP